MDGDYISKLTTAQYQRLVWYSGNEPKPRAVNTILQDKTIIELWKKTPYYDDFRKIFPPYKVYRFACRKFGVAPKPPFKQGIPQSIIKELFETHPTNSILDIYKSLYNLSYHNDLWKMRVCEVSHGLIKKDSGYCFRTISRNLNFLRSKWFIRRIWRGRPWPEDPRYLHSCYELPVNINHITYWRINHGRKRQKTKSSF